MLHPQRPLFQIGALCSGRMWLSNRIVMDACSLRLQDGFIKNFSNKSMATCLFLIWIFKCFLNNSFADQNIHSSEILLMYFSSALPLRSVFNHKLALTKMQTRQKTAYLVKKINKILMFCLFLRRLFCEFLIHWVSFCWLLVWWGFFRCMWSCHIKLNNTII